MTRTLSLLIWLDHHPQVYLCLVGGLLGLTVAFAAAPFLRGRPDDASRHDWWWGLPVLAILFAGRWPALIFTRELGVDESQLLAGAHALTHDPVFWRSVNGGTAGPLDFFALWPAGWICGWDTFFTARVTATLLIAACLVLAHQCLALLAGRSVARVAGLAALGVESLTHGADFLHYSTELVPMVLLAGAAYAAVRRWHGAGGPLWSGLGGLLLGAVPFSKLQPVPLALVMGLVWLAAELRPPTSSRHRAYLIAGALLPAGLFACQLTIAGEWISFFRSYLVFNFQYAGAGSGETAAQSLVVMLGNALWWDNLLPVALLGAAVWLALLVRLRPCPDRALRVLTWSAAVGCAVALACIIGPKRPYLHYWQLLVVPGTLLLGALTARLVMTSPPRWKRLDQILAGGLAVVFVGLLLVHRGVYPNLFVGELAYFNHVPRSDLALHVQAQSRPGEAIAIWGRADHLYVETGLRQATRDSHVSQLIEPGPMRDYSRERYLADLVIAKPATFLDAVCPGSVQYKTPEFAHEHVYPELGRVIGANYVLVEEFEGARIYRRRDLVGR
jgi:hypothetical protein